MLTTIAQAALVMLALAAPLPVPKDAEVPDELEVCILTAEVCIANATNDTCAPPTYDERSACADAYEACATGIVEPYVETCRVAWVWCVIKNDYSKKDLILYCEAVRDTCGT